MMRGYLARPILALLFGATACAPTLFAHDADCAPREEIEIKSFDNLIDEQRFEPNGQHRDIVVHAAKMLGEGKEFHKSLLDMVVAQRMDGIIQSIRDHIQQTPSMGLSITENIEKQFIATVINGYNHNLKAFRKQQNDPSCADKLGKLREFGRWIMREELQAHHIDIDDVPDHLRTYVEKRLTAQGINPKQALIINAPMWGGIAAATTLCTVQRKIFKHDQQRRYHSMDDVEQDFEKYYNDEQQYLTIIILDLTSPEWYKKITSKNYERYGFHDIVEQNPDADFDLGLANTSFEDTKAIISHECSHIYNGDTLLHPVLRNFPGVSKSYEHAADQTAATENPPMARTIRDQILNWYHRFGPRRFLTSSLSHGSPYERYQGAQRIVHYWNAYDWLMHGRLPDDHSKVDIIPTPIKAVGRTALKKVCELGQALCGIVPGSNR